ncbi:MAG: PAS domain S-box protein, partial [Acidimicrobiia bacterium]|nr:PAS domain S-box protein [Acidimicrobiia bacterium]
MATATGRTARTHAEDDNALFHAHPQPAWVCDPATGAILDVNAAAVQAYGYDRPAFLAMRIDDVVAARLGDLVTHHRKRNGDVIDVKQTASSVVINGRVARMIVAVDVTEERERERALLTSEKRLRDLIDATSAVVYVKALDGRYVLVNQRYEELTGFSRDQVLGRSDAELWPAPFAAAIRANDLRVLDA